MFEDPRIITALIAATVSIITTLFLKPIIDKRFLKYSLEQNFKYEQRKQIKEVLARRKFKLINACQFVSYRLGTFARNFQDYNMQFDPKRKNEESPFFDSFLYRLLHLIGWLKVIENELIYLDTSVATKEDLYFIKYIKLFTSIFCEARLHNSLEKVSDERDQLLWNDFDILANSVITDQGVIDYSEFLLKKEEIKKECTPLCEFLNSISPEEERYRWDRLQLLHITILTFLNSFGYDFHHRSPEIIQRTLNLTGRSRMLGNFKELLSYYKLEKYPEIKQLVQLI